VGFTQQDFEELRLKLDKIRFGPRVVKPPPISIPGLLDLRTPKRPAARDRRKPPPDPGYERFQLRLW
jgi:hypothetical protein